MDILDDQDDRSAGAHGLRASGEPPNWPSRASPPVSMLLELGSAPSSAEQEREDVDDFGVVDVMGARIPRRRAAPSAALRRRRNSPLYVSVAADAAPNASRPACTGREAVSRAGDACAGALREGCATCRSPASPSIRMTSPRPETALVPILRRSSASSAGRDRRADWLRRPKAKKRSTSRLWLSALPDLLGLAQIP